MHDVFAQRGIVRASQSEQESEVVPFFVSEREHLREAIDEIW